MKLSAPLVTFALLAPAARATYLSPCSTTSTTPCSCPSGTNYVESVTFAVIGAAATDVKALMSDFFKTAWLGVVPLTTSGPGNTPGSTRTSNVPTLIGIYEFTEKLTKLRTDPDGSFIQKFEQLASTVPVEYRTGNGSFAGYWITLETKAIFQYETAVVWSNYGCETGYPRNYAAFHERALQNATNVLQAEGKIRGTNLKPVSIQAF